MMNEVKEGKALMTVNATLVKELREKTGAGVMDCKEALLATQSDLEKSIEYLRRKGIAMASKKSSRVTSEGMVSSYIHGGGKIGVLVEVNCETDFVAKTQEFQEFVKDISMQIAAARPTWISKEEVPSEVIEKERSIYAEQARSAGKPEKVIEKIVEGKLDKFFQDECLLDQPFVKDPEISVNQLLTSKIAKVGENIVIRRFARYQLGEGV